MVTMQVGSVRFNFFRQGITILRIVNDKLISYSPWQSCNQYIFTLLFDRLRPRHRPFPLSSGSLRFVALFPPFLFLTSKVVLFWGTYLMISFTLFVLFRPYLSSFINHAVPVKFSLQVNGERHRFAFCVRLCATLLEIRNVFRRKSQLRERYQIWTMQSAC